MSTTTVAVANTTATLHNPPNLINSPNLSFSNNLTLQTLTFKLKLKHKTTSHPSPLNRFPPKITNSAAINYAVALADVANANKTLDATLSDIEKINKLFSNESVLTFFTSPIIALEQKHKLIDDMTSSGLLQPHVCNFLNVLIERNRIGLVREIVDEFEVVYNKLTGTEMAVVTSVVRLEKQHLAQIAKQVQRLTGARNVRVRTVIDEKLVAGFTVRYGSGLSKLIDMSVKKQLDDIAAQLEVGDMQIAV